MLVFEIETMDGKRDDGSISSFFRPEEGNVKDGGRDDEQEPASDPSDTWNGWRGFFHTADEKRFDTVF